MLKRIVVLTGPVAALVALVGSVIASAGRLPDPLATHWALDGRPDGKAGAALLAAGLALVVAAAGGVLAAQAVRHRRDGTLLTAAPWTWALAGSLLAVQLVIVAANLDAPSWEAARAVGPWVAPLVLLAGAGAAWVAHALERGRPVRVPAGTPAGGRPTVGLAPGERAVWTGHQAPRIAPAAAAAGGAAFAVAAWVTGGAAGWALLAAGLVLAAAIVTVSEVTVTVDGRGLTIAHGPLRRPRRTIPLGDIDEVEATHVDPWRVGGWGVRKVPGRRGATAIVVRGGPGLRVVRVDGRELLVTVPDPGTAAGLLADLAGRGPQPGSTSWPPAKSWASRT